MISNAHMLALTEDMRVKYIRCSLGYREQKQEPTMSNYWKRLKKHPGVPLASFLTLTGAFMGTQNESMSLFYGALWGALIMGVWCWPIVLWTARTQPSLKEDETHDQNN